jgi:hypothetical protein
MGDDPNAEIRAMVLLTLPYPPLPVFATRVELDDHRLQDDALITSHTLIARALNEAVLRNDPRENDARKARQLQNFQTFLHAMAVEGFSCDSERLYLIYCRFTLEHIATYFPPNHPVDVRFEPLSSIVRGDRAHVRLAEYMASQSIYLQDPVPVSREQYLKQGFHELLAVCRDRLGHCMTDEERASLQQIVENSGH